MFGLDQFSARHDVFGRAVGAQLLGRLARRLYYYDGAFDSKKEAISLYESFLKFVYIIH